MPEKPTTTTKTKETSHQSGDVEVFFTREYKVKDAVGTTYKEGQRVKMSPESAAHFTNGGPAIMADDKRAMAEYKRVKALAGEEDEE